MKCDVCGMESDFSAAFRKERKAFRKSAGTYCPVCWQRYSKMISILPLIILSLVGIVSYGALWLSKLPELELARQALSTIVLLYLFFILSIVPHELGHAIAAWLVGFRVFNIAFGYGKLLFKFRLFGTIVSFHWVPIVGIVRSAPRAIDWHRTKYFIKILAGPAANAIIVVAIVYISWHHNGVPVSAQLFLIANLLILISAIVPYRYSSLNLDSDGKQMILVFSKKQKQIEQAHAAHFLLEATTRWNEHRDIEDAVQWCEKGLALYPDELQLLNMRGLLCLERGAFAQGREIYLQLLQRESKPSAWRFALLNNIAYSDVLLGDPSLLPEANTCSEEAYKNLPWADFAIGTRGTVLVEMKKYEEGIKLLKESIKKTEDTRSKALNACHLSIAYSRMGDFDQAAQYLKLARHIDSRCSLLERAEAELRKHQGRPLPDTSVARD
jgi:tetratricopeptide (TPR) repeat protein